MLIRQKKIFCKVLCSSNSRGFCIFSSKLVVFLIWYIFRSFHRIQPNLVGKSFITSKCVSYTSAHIDQQRALLYYDAFSSNLVICLIFYISSSINRVEPNVIDKTLITKNHWLNFGADRPAGGVITRHTFSSDLVIFFYLS